MVKEIPWYKSNQCDAYWYILSVSDLCPDFETSFKETIYIATEVFKFTIFVDQSLVISLFVYFWGFSFHSRIFHSYGNVTITREGQQILTYASHSWTLRSEGSLACYTYCGKVQSPRTRGTHTYCRAFGSGAATTCFLT